MNCYSIWRWQETLKKIYNLHSLKTTSRLEKRTLHRQKLMGAKDVKCLGGKKRSGGVRCLKKRKEGRKKGREGWMDGYQF